MAFEPPAGGWAAVRFQASASWLEGGELILAIGIDPDAGAEPYLGFGINTPPFAPAMFLVALNGTLDAQMFRIAVGGGPGPPGAPPPPTPEVMFLFGSSAGRVRYHVAALSSAPAAGGSQLARLVAERPLLPAGPDHLGVGGWVGTAVYIEGDQGRAAWTAGPVTLDLQVVEAPGVATLERRLVAHAERGIPEPGFASFIFGSHGHTGAGTWRFRADLPPQTYNGSSVDATAVDRAPPSVGPLSLAPPNVVGSVRTGAGAARFEAERVFAGDGTVYIASWGWTSADPERLYGWKMQDIVQGL